jgi:hypothetical protein
MYIFTTRIVKDIIEGRIDQIEAQARRDLRRIESCFDVWTAYQISAQAQNIALVEGRM